MESLKVKLMMIAAAGVLAGAGFIFSCGGSDDALTTPPANQTQIAQEASAEALGIATQVTNIAMALMQGGMSIGSAPKSPIQPMDKFEWNNNFLCPRSGKVETLPNGCNLALEAYEDGSCESIELQLDYAEGCTEAQVWKEGEGSIKLEVIDPAELPANTDQGFQLTVSFSDFVEGDKSQDGELIFTAASADNEQSGELKIETGSSGYTENGKKSSGYALMTYSANGTVSVVGKNKATEANLTMEADITSTEDSANESIDITDLRINNGK